MHIHYSNTPFSGKIANVRYINDELDSEAILFIYNSEKDNIE